MSYPVGHWPGSRPDRALLTTERRARSGDGIREGDVKITREYFIKATGREPQDDDLDRCNCPHAGEIGHFCCGWDTFLNQPQFDTGPRWNGSPVRRREQ
jgi:hypothetical protein